MFCKNTFFLITIFASYAFGSDKPIDASIQDMLTSHSVSDLMDRESYTLVVDSLSAIKSPKKQEIILRYALDLNINNNYKGLDVLITTLNSVQNIDKIAIKIMALCSGFIDPDANIGIIAKKIKEIQDCNFFKINAINIVLKINEKHSRKLNFDEITTVLFKMPLETLEFFTKTLLPYIGGDIIDILLKASPPSFSSESVDHFNQIETINTFFKLYVDHKLSQLHVRFSIFFTIMKDLPTPHIFYAVQSAAPLLKKGFLDELSLRSFIIYYQVEGMTKEHIDSTISRILKEKITPKDFMIRFRSLL